MGQIRSRRGNKFEWPGVEMIGLRLTFTITLLLGGFSSLGAVEAQQAAKVARIGWLGDSEPRGYPLPEAFLKGLRDLGYVEGRDVVSNTDLPTESSSGTPLSRPNWSH